MKLNFQLTSSQLTRGGQTVQSLVLSTQYDTDKMDSICTQCGLKGLVEKLPHGYDTQVDKWIDPEGFEPSGGEDQRIAIARACYHGGEIFLLDEPTAALDPVAEYEIYTQFNKKRVERRLSGNFKEVNLTMWISCS